jgi:hypothetical protein
VEVLPEAGPGVRPEVLDHLVDDGSALRRRKKCFLGWKRGVDVVAKVRARPRLGAGFTGEHGEDDVR